MKVLLIGPYPPPHGGISTHVAELCRKWTEEGVRCCVLNTTGDRGQSGTDAKDAGLGDRICFALKLVRYGVTGWTFHVHTNGHNRNSWLLAGLCGLAGKLRGGHVLTLHSGMAPGYVSASPGRAGRVCSLFQRIVCVSKPIRDALAGAGVPIEKIEVRPAYIGLPLRNVALNPSLSAWIQMHSPVLAATLFFRPEYGFDLLASAMTKLRRRHPSIGCVVMGSGEQRQQAERVINDAGLDENVLLAGDVSHDMCLSVMAHSNLFVRPTFEDGDSVSVREALELGIPVVASRAGARPAGVILFETGNGEDLCAKVQLALSAAAKERNHAIA